MKTIALPTQERLRELFDYRNGELIWLKPSGRRAKPGQVAGARDKCGYRVVGVDGRLYKGHRLIWVWHHGNDPGRYVDHLDGDPRNNRIENLEPVTNRENVVRGRICKGKDSDLPVNVSLANPGHNVKKPYQVKFGGTVDGKRWGKCIGTYATVEEAVAARDNFLSR